MTYVLCLYGNSYKETLQLLAMEISEISKLYNEFHKKIEDKIKALNIHPYFERTIVAILFFYLFYNLLSFSLYPKILVLLLASSVALVSLKSRIYALMWGLTTSFPIFIYQELAFSLVFIVVSALIIVYSFKDWKMGYIIYLSLVLAVNHQYSFSILIILLYGYLFGSKKGITASFFSSVLIILFGYGLNTSWIGLFILPPNEYSYLMPWKGVLDEITLTNWIVIDYSIGNSSFLLSMVNLASNHTYTLLQILTYSVAGYLAGNVQQWKLRFREFIAIPIAAIAVIAGSFVTEMFLSGTTSRLQILAPPFFILAIFTSAIAPFINTVLLHAQIVTFKDVETPQIIKNKLDQLLMDNNNLSLEIQMLNRKNSAYQEKKHYLRYLQGILREMKDTEWISSIDISTKTGVPLNMTDKILAFLSENNFLMYDKGRAIDKYVIKDKIYDRLNVDKVRTSVPLKSNVRLNEVNESNDALFPLDDLINHELSKYDESQYTFHKDDWDSINSRSSDLIKLSVDELRNMAADLREMRGVSRIYYDTTKGYLWVKKFGLKIQIYWCTVT